MELSTSTFWTAFWVYVRYFFPELDDPNLKTYNVPQNEMKNAYDFVIVGAGAGGCVVARRLTENPDWTVLLIEAGREEDAKSETPLFSPIFANTDFDWNYTTVRQTRSCLSTDGVCKLVRGKAMGGSTAIYGMAYIRGNRKDYDRWEELGNSGWGYETMLRYFVKSENNTESALISSGYHGTEGPLNVQYPKLRTPLWNEYVKAGVEMGLQKKDPNGKEQTGIHWKQHVMEGAEKVSAAKAYVNPVRNRPNLHVIKKSRAIKVLFDGKRRKAKGVKYIRKNKMFTVNAKREVILSAGAIDTPKLLMLSGIGPRDTLKKHKTEVISNLPVGRNFQDHVQIQLNFEVNKNVTITSDVWKNRQSIIQYTKYKQGPLSVGGGETIAFFNSMDRKEIPNTEIQFFSFLREFEKPQHKHIVHLIMYLLNPKSMGTVTLKSSNPLDPPLIDPNFLDDVYDFDSMFKGAKIAFQYMNTPTMAKYSPTLYLEDQPLCKNKKPTSEVIICLIKYYSYPGDHAVGTARMGPAGDPGAVVTPQLMVRGFENLRVVDASIMPFIVRGNTMAATVAVAEKASDIIKHYHSMN